MEIPVSTYRLQLNAACTLADVENILPYLHQLGISTIYASPFFAATTGSTHGYDVCDPHALNSEIGTFTQLQQIAQLARTYNITWLQDMVPNHMAFSMHNRRLADVLERGPYSTYYRYFDINWQHPDPSLTGKLMVPFLGKPLAECVQDGEIILDIEDNGFVVKYINNSYPLSVTAYNIILERLANDPGATALSDVFKQLYARAIADPSLVEWTAFKHTLIRNFLNDAAAISFTRPFLSTLNHDKPFLLQLLQHQYYQLSFWQLTNQLINYRRFFAVNELIAVNMQDESVFNDYHYLLYELYKKQIIHGLRIDHIDGLRDPGNYIQRLRQLFGNECYIIVEKILEQLEQMPAHWPLQGTTGYEFLSYVNWLLTDGKGAQKMVDTYHELLPHTRNYDNIVFENKRLFLQTYMAGEWNNLVEYLYTLQLAPGHPDRENIKQALGLFMCCLPVYRLYPDERSPDDTAKQTIKETIVRAIHKAPELSRELQYIHALWQPIENDAPKNNNRISFLQRLMQFTGPLMAKGVEDTTFYVYNALLAHNEVGDTPYAVDFSIDIFHQHMLNRQRTHPFSLNATSTHDTKRGEDARIRLHVLTLFPDEWKAQVQHWMLINEKYKIKLPYTLAPDLQDEYFIYQSIVAGMPPDGIATEEYINRLKAYFIKAVREAKINSNWHNPDTMYEEACCDFIQGILTRQDFLNHFGPFFHTIHNHAAVFSLLQVLIKITAPGIPDIYQGSELWNLSYVDPDNRRPVDYSLRKKYLDELVQQEQRDPAGLPIYVTGKRQEGLEKLFVTWKALQCRKKWAQLFKQGNYYPLYASAGCNIIAYARKYQRQWAIVVAPVLNAIMMPGNKEPWTGISLKLPDGAPVNWKNEFTGETLLMQKSIPLNTIINVFPVALLTGESK